MTDKWINHVKDSVITEEGRHGNSICFTCGKHMRLCWDTVCAVCGHTFCYKHSTAKGGRWVCPKHKNMSAEDIQQASKSLRLTYPCNLKDLREQQGGK